MTQKRLLLERMPSTIYGTRGFLTFEKHTLCTIERPWIPTEEHQGGKNFESCVPAGKYKLRLHKRADGKIVLALVNPELDVYYLETDVPQGKKGRWLILMHIANYVKDVVGCIGPGLSKVEHPTMYMVTSSGVAMEQIMKYAEGGTDMELEIRWIV